jgi:hypothetical protein
MADRYQADHSILTNNLRN